MSWHPVGANLGGGLARGRCRVCNPALEIDGDVPLVVFFGELPQIRNLKSLWHVNKSDFFIWVLTAVFSVFGDLDIGLLVGVVFSMVTVLLVSQLAKGTVLGKATNEDIILDLDRRGVSAFPGIRIFRWVGV